MARLPLLLALLAPLAAAQPIADPPPSTAEIAPGVTLTVDWEPFVWAERDVVLEEGGTWPATVDGCEFWLGMDGLPYEEQEGVVLASAVVERDGVRIDLATECVIEFEPGVPADAFDVSAAPFGLVEISTGIGDGAGTSLLGWVVGPSGARRFDADDPGGFAAGQAGQIGAQLAAATAADDDARDRLAVALAVSVAADRAADDARREMEARRALAITTRDGIRRTLADLADVLASLGAEVPDAPPEAGPLALSACAVVPDSAAADGILPPGSAVTLVAEAASADPVVAWVDLGDGTSDLVAVEDGVLHVPHAYAYAGTYRATVTAIDPGGSETCAVEVTVGAGEDPFCADVTELNPVFFGFRSSEPLSQGDARIDENADLLRRCPSLCVKINGFGDVDDVAMTETRAEVVRQRYVARGIDASRLRAEGRGEGPGCNPFEDPGPGDQRCRRVESVPVACEGGP